MRKLAPERVSYRDDFLISYRVYMMTGSFHISLFEGTLHVDKIHVWFKIANITHALPVPEYRQTNFTPKRVVSWCCGSPNDVTFSLFCVSHYHKVQVFIQPLQILISENECKISFGLSVPTNSVKNFDLIKPGFNWHEPTNRKRTTFGSWNEEEMWCGCISSLENISIKPICIS